MAKSKKRVTSHKIKYWSMCRTIKELEKNKVDFDKKRESTKARIFADDLVIGYMRLITRDWWFINPYTKEKLSTGSGIPEFLEKLKFYQQIERLFGENPCPEVVCVRNSGSESPREKRKRKNIKFMDDAGWEYTIPPKSNEKHAIYKISDIITANFYLTTGRRPQPRRTTSCHHAPLYHAR